MHLPVYMFCAESHPVELRASLVCLTFYGPSGGSCRHK